MNDLSNDAYYRHSGRMGWAIPLMLLIGIPALAVLAGAYSYIVYYCPVVGYVNIVFLWGLVLGGTQVIHWIGKVSKCRSPAVMMVMSFLAGLTTLYFVWVFFIKAWAGAEVDLLQLFASPTGLANLIYHINQQGWWTPSGLVQWILSGSEAVVVVGGYTLAGSSSIQREVFCEDCNQWCESFETMRLKPNEEIGAEAPADLKPEQLLALEEAEVDEFPRFDAEVLHCKGCESLQAIRIEHVTQKLDDGELKEERSAIPGILIQRG